MLNRVILIGRLTKDPELKYTPNGVAVANFTLAVDRFRTNAQGEKEVDFIPVVVWQKQAENAANYLAKGSLCAIDGRMQVRTYEDKDKQKHWVTEVIAESVRFLSKKSDSPKAESPENLGKPMEFSDDDIPW